MYCIYIDNWYIIDIVSHYIDTLFTVKPLLLLPVNLDPEADVLMIFCGEAILDDVSGQRLKYCTTVDCCPST
jgi:hypothetical protein